MIEIKVDFKTSILKRNLNLFDEKLQRNIQRAIEASALEVRKTAIKNISSGARSGKTYRKKRGLHIASAPGEYPKTDTGRLVASIRTDFGTGYALVGSDLDYSAFLEKGTRKMDKRPWLQRSKDLSAAQIQKYMDDAIRDALR